MWIVLATRQPKREVLDGEMVWVRDLIGVRRGNVRDRVRTALAMGWPKRWVQIRTALAIG